MIMIMIIIIMIIIIVISRFVEVIEPSTFTVAAKPLINNKYSNINAYVFTYVYSATQVLCSVRSRNKMKTAVDLMLKVQ